MSDGTPTKGDEGRRRPAKLPRLEASYSNQRENNYCFYHSFVDFTLKHVSFRGDENEPRQQRRVQGTKSEEGAESEKRRRKLSLHDFFFIVLRSRMPLHDFVIIIDAIRVN